MIKGVAECSRNIINDHFITPCLVFGIIRLDMPASLL